MRVVRVTIFQKKLGFTLDLVTAKRLQNLQTDFLVFPEFFHVDEKVDKWENLHSQNAYTLEWLLKLSQQQSYIILGGTLLRKVKEKDFRLSVPVFYQGQLINWYDKRELTAKEKKFARSGTNDGIEMLKNLRFAFLCGQEFKSKKIIQEYHKQQVALAFIISNSNAEEKIENTYKTVEEYNQKYKMCFVRCSGTGKMIGNTILGRSFICMKNGISWKVNTDCEDQEILKTIIVNI